MAYHAPVRSKRAVRTGDRLVAVSVADGYCCHSGGTIDRAPPRTPRKDSAHHRPIGGRLRRLNVNPWP